MHCVLAEHRGSERALGNWSSMLGLSPLFCFNGMTLSYMPDKLSDLKAYRFAEFFAGDANLSWALKNHGFSGLSFDQSYGGRWNNIHEPAGFASLECMATFHLLFLLF